MTTSGQRISADALYDLVLAATRSKAKAQAAHNAVVAEQLRRNETPS